MRLATCELEAGGDGRTVGEVRDMPPRDSRRYTPTGEEANLKYYEMFAGLQISGLKFQSLKSLSRELELSNFLGLVLGCIEANFCK